MPSPTLDADLNCLSYLSKGKVVRPSLHRLLWARQGLPKSASVPCVGGYVTLYYLACCILESVNNKLLEGPEQICRLYRRPNKRWHGKPRKEMGDVEEVKCLLEFMTDARIDADILHYSSAINACKNSANGSSHAEARDFMKELLNKGLKPNIVTFTNFAGAHRNAELEKFEHLLVMLPQHHVKPNSIFVETFLAALFHGYLSYAWSVGDVAKQLAGVSPDRLQVARTLLQDAKAKGIKLTKLSTFVSEYLS